MDEAAVEVKAEAAPSTPSSATLHRTRLPHCRVMLRHRTHRWLTPTTSMQSKPAPHMTMHSLQVWVSTSRQATSQQPCSNQFHQLHCTPRSILHVASLPNVDTMSWLAHQAVLPCHIRCLISATRTWRTRDTRADLPPPFHSVVSPSGAGHPTLSRAVVEPNAVAIKIAEASGRLLWHLATISSRHG